MLQWLESEVGSLPLSPLGSRPQRSLSNGGTVWDHPLTVHWHNAHPDMECSQK